MTISDLDKLEGVEFEQALKAPLLTIGFSEIVFTPKTADFGADVIAKKENRKCAIQIKRSTSPISISAVQEVLGALAYYECVEGLVITNSIFTPGAVELAKRAKVQLVARDQLKQWLSKLKLADKTAVIKPFPYQTEALIELARYRAGRKLKSLVIMAAGLGKTYTSALDVAQFESGLGRPARVMFADYDLPSKSGGLEQYFESDTVQRFIRQVLRKQDNPTLFDENYVSKLIKRKPTDLHRMEKWGQLAPSWFHKTPSGRALFYYSEADIAELRKLNRA